MIQIVVDDAFRQQCRASDELCAIVDVEGNRLGFFMPEADRSLYENLEVPFSEEDLLLADAEEEGRALVDILSDLERRR